MFNKYEEIINSEEALLKNEPVDNSYIVLEPQKMCNFPNILLGIIRCIYELENVKEISEGVGILIGADIILTSAHNLCNKNKEGKIQFPDSVEFIPLINGRFQIVSQLKCIDFSIPKEFIKLKFQGNGLEEEIINYDYGIVFLEKSLGDEYIRIFGDSLGRFLSYSSDNSDENNNDLKLFNFLESNVKAYKNYQSSNINRALSKSKISMVSYTRYNSEFMNCPNFRYKTSFNILNKKLSYSVLDKNIQGKLKSHSVSGKKMNIDKYINQTINEGNQNSFGSHDVQQNLSVNSFQNTTKNLMSLHSIDEKMENSNSNDINKISNSNVNLHPITNDKYVILTERIKIPSYSNKFYEDDQVVLCEAKGKLCNYNFSTETENKNFNNKNELRYMITTYGGQSGSPIFLKIKNKNLKSDDCYEYILIGIHSRCPIESIIPGKNEKYVPGSRSGMFSHTIYEEREDSSSEINYEKKLKENSKELLIEDNCSSSPNKNEKDSLSIIQNSFLARTPVSDYNIGLKLTPEVLEDIKILIRNKRKEMNAIKAEKKEDLFESSEFIYTNCLSYDKFLFSGFFHKNSQLIHLFKIAESHIEIPAVFLNLQIGDKIIYFSKDEESEAGDVNYSVYDMKICDLIEEDQVKNLFLFKATITFNINIKKYGDSIAKKLINKLKDFDEEFEYDKLKKKEKVKIYTIIKFIFDEIQFIYNKSIHLHGLLFKTVRDKIFEYFEES